MDLSNQKIVWNTYSFQCKVLIVEEGILVQCVTPIMSWEKREKSEVWLLEAWQKELAPDCSKSEDFRVWISILFLRLQTWKWFCILIWPPEVHSIIDFSDFTTNQIGTVSSIWYLRFQSLNMSLQCWNIFRIVIMTYSIINTWIQNIWCMWVIAMIYSNDALKLIIQNHILSNFSVSVESEI